MFIKCQAQLVSENEDGSFTISVSSPDIKAIRVYAIHAIDVDTAAFEALKNYSDAFTGLMVGDVDVASSGVKSKH